MSIFRELVGTSPESKVLEYLLIWGDNTDITTNDVINYAKIGKERAYQIIEKFKKIGLIVETRSIGKAKLYKLNSKSNLAKSSREFLTKVLKISAKKKAKAS